MPTSAMARMASGCTEVFSVPALPASNRSPAMERSHPSAIWLRAELCVQRKSTRDLAMSGSRRLVDQTLHDDAVAPLAFELAVPLIRADDPEAAALMKGQARRVLREDPRHDLPEAALRVGLAQRLQGFPSSPCSTDRARHVHGVLGHARVGGATAIGPGTPPGHGAPISLHHHRGEAVALVGELLLKLLGGARIRLEGCDAIRDPLVVDRSDGGCVGRGGQPGLE